VLYYNDVTTPFLQSIRDRNRLSEMIQTLVHYYDVASFHYGSVVSDIILGDPKETWFSVDEFPQGQSAHYVHKSDMHPGQGMHMVSSWIIAYGMIDLLSNACAWRHLLVDEDASTRWTVNLPEYEDTSFARQIPLQRQPELPSQGLKPRPAPHGLPPPLSSTLTPQDLIFDWQLMARNKTHGRKSACQPRACPLQWMSGHGKGKDEEWVRTNILSKVQGEWTLGDVVDFRKAGLTPMRLGSTMRFPVSEGSSSLLIFYLKSYGDKWTNATARIDLVEGDVVSSSVTLAGFHNRTTSELYVHEFRLPNFQQTYHLKATLIDGTTFKIMGIVQCH